MVIDHGFERKLLEAVRDDGLLSKDEEKRLVWLNDQEFVVRYGDYERGISKKEWREYK